MGPKRFHKLLFIGDSLIEFFDWQARFPDFLVENYGLAGESVKGLLSRSQAIAENVAAPDFILIMIGTNNVAIEDFSFLPDYEAIINTFQHSYPATEIIVNGLFPMRVPWLADSAITQTNELLEELASSKRIGYMDGFNIFSDHQNCFLEDGVHISDHGYRLWSNAIEDLIIQ